MMGFFFHLRPFLPVLIVLQILEFGESHLASITQLSEENLYASVFGDPGMKNPNSRFAFEAWNFCNEVRFEAPNMRSPRMADCADLQCHEIADSSSAEKSKCQVHQKVKGSDNRLRAGDRFPIREFKSYTDPNAYAVEKELYLGLLCTPPDSPDSWYFWMIMLKNGNFDKNTTLCPKNGKKVAKIVTNCSFPFFGEGCMNQPLVFHNKSKLVSSAEGKVSLVGGFYGTYDLDADLSAGAGRYSFFSASWQKKLGR